MLGLLGNELPGGTPPPVPAGSVFPPPPVVGVGVGVGELDVWDLTWTVSEAEAEFPACFEVPVMSSVTLLPGPVLGHG